MTGEREREREGEAEFFFSYQLWDSMACVRSYWLLWALWGLCSLLAFVFAQDSSWECSDKDELLSEMAMDVNMPSECTLGCTALTYRRVLELQVKVTVRFKDSQAGDSDEYCWSTQIRCSRGQSLQSAFVLLPVDMLVVNGQNVTLQVSLGPEAETLQQHTGDSFLPTDCGLRFDVTEQLTLKDRQPSLCVRTSLELELRCPPFLVTTWRQWNQGEG